MRRSAARSRLLNCDNLRSNGERFRGGSAAVHRTAERQPVARLGGGEHQHSTPWWNRITPRPTSDVAERVKRATGWDDAAPVMSESFING